MRTLIFVLSFFIYSLSFAQCNDGNNATLAETKAWLKLIFSENGDKNAGYYSIMDTSDSTEFKCARFAYNAGFERYDTAYIAKFKFKDIIKYEIDYNKKNTVFDFKIFANNLNIRHIPAQINSKDEALKASMELANATDALMLASRQAKGMKEFTFVCKDKPNLHERLQKAFDHAKCKCGGVNVDKDKF